MIEVFDFFWFQVLFGYFCFMKRLVLLTTNMLYFIFIRAQSRVDSYVEQHKIIEQMRFENLMEQIKIYAAIIVLPSILIAFFLGRKKQIGLGWSLFLCLFLTPIIGTVAVLFSRSVRLPNPNPSIVKQVIGYVLIVLGIISVTAPYWQNNFQVNNDLDTMGRFFYYQYSIGIIGLGMVLEEIGSGKRFDRE
jgi:hypothetical protein